MSRIRLAVCTAALAVAAVGLAGCGGGGDDGPKPQKSQSIPSEVPSNLPSNVPSGSSTGTAKPGKLPAGFPLPPGAKKGEITTANGATGGTITVKDGGKAFDFWTKQLPKKGYTVTSKNKVEIQGTKSLITFNGKGYASATITITDRTAQVSLQK